MLDGTTNQMLKNRTKTWVEKNDNTKAGVMRLLIKLNFELP